MWVCDPLPLLPRAGHTHMRRDFHIARVSPPLHWKSLRASRTNPWMRTELRSGEDCCEGAHLPCSHPSGSPPYCRAMKVLCFCVFSLLCSRLHRAAAWTTLPSLQHARQLSHLRSPDSATSSSSISTSTSTSGSSSRPLSRRHTAAPRDSSAVSPSGWWRAPPPPHAHRTSRSSRNSATAGALSMTSPSSTSTDTDTAEVEGGAVGYKVDEAGRCSGVEPLPPLKNRYYALRHGQSVANM